MPQNAEAPTSAPWQETILIVEDNKELRQLTSKILGTNGYKVLEADGGAQAEEEMRSAMRTLLGRTTTALALALLVPALADDEKPPASRPTKKDDKKKDDKKK